jgi:murein L,D-transpeptidase YcbB/YkuD
VDVGLQPEAAALRVVLALRAVIISALALTAAGVANCSRGHATAEQQPLQAAAAPVPPPAPPAPPPIRALTPTEALAALQTLRAAPDQGFSPRAFGDIPHIAELVQSADPAQKAEGGQRLTRAVLAYARAEHGFGIRRSQLPAAWGIQPPAYDADADLRAALDQNRFADWLMTLPPSEPRYQALVEALAAYRKIAAEGRSEHAHPRSEHSEHSEQPAAQDTAASGGDAASDSDLTDAVTRFQSHNGLEPTGDLDPDTVQAMNMPTKARIDHIRANLERWRWMPRDMPATRIEVNVPSFTLDYYSDGQNAMHMLAAAGKVKDKTPMLISKITDIELNPPWRIPADIARREFFPRGRGYLASHHIVRGPSRSAPLIQRAGPKSSLGRVKFEFDSDYGVYLHDTPTKSTFDSNERSVSHGCVRLQHAIDLAKLLLQTTPGWSGDRVDQALTNTRTQWVRLAQPVPVMLVYWTAYAEGGQTFFSGDPYDWDPILVRLLDAPEPDHG